MSSFFDLSRAKYNPVAASEFVRPEKGNARHENLEKSTRASALSRLRKNSSIPSFDFEFPTRFPPNFYYTPSVSSRERSKIEHMWKSSEHIKSKTFDDDLSFFEPWWSLKILQVRIRFRYRFIVVILRKISETYISLKKLLKIVPFSRGNKLWLVLRKHGPVPVNFLVHARWWNCASDFFPSSATDLRALLNARKKKVKEFSLFRHFRLVFAFIHRISPTRSIDRIPRESIVEIIGVTREPDDGPVLSGTFALCVALSCNTSAQPDFTGGEFRQRRDASLISEVTWVSTFRRSSICITLRKERNERGSRP